MRNESTIFNLSGAFFLLMAIIYGLLTHFKELVGFPAILLTSFLALMMGVYFRMLAKRHGARPEDRGDGEIAELPGEQGVYSPWSWWPLVLALSAAMGFLALAAGWWIMVPAAMAAAVGLTGWVFEFSRGQHEH